jgi:hypothetical protein
MTSVWLVPEKDPWMIGFSRRLILERLQFCTLVRHAQFPLKIGQFLFLEFQTQAL